MKHFVQLFIQLFLLLCIISLSVQATTYYIDFEDGKDANDGLSEASAWKHCPGDANATGIVAGYTPSAGDVFLFKGGVIYRGTIRLSADGNPDASITLKGNGWGTEQAVIDGSELIPTTWTKCTSAEECGDNPNWEEIWWTDTTMEPLAKNNYAYSANLHQGNDFLYVAQWPSPTDPFYYDNVENYAQATIGQTSLTHPELESLGGIRLVGATILIHSGNNTVSPFKILDYSANTITYEKVTHNNYSNFALSNYEAFIDAPGEYVYHEEPDEEGKHRIFLWPINNENPNEMKISLSVRENAIHIASGRNIIVEGFKIVRTSGSGSTNEGVPVRAVNGGENIIIRNNLIEHCRFGQYGGYGGIYLNNVDRGLVEENLVQWNSRHRGIFCCNCENTIVRKNVIKRSGLTAIGFYGCVLSQIIDNVVTDCRGGHGNGLTFYLYNKKILIARNYVEDANICVTVEKSEDLTFYNNFFDGTDNTSYVLINRGGEGTGGKFLLLNNTIVNSSKSCAVQLQLSSEQVDIAVKNNIVDGMSIDFPEDIRVRTHNLYVGLTWSQKPRYGWSPGEEEQVIYDGDSYLAIPDETVFKDPIIGGDYSLLQNSPARNSGTDILHLLPTSDFPNFDFTVDISGNPRGSDANWDVGAYEYIDDKPLINVQPQSHTVEAGKTVMFSVEALGSDMRYQWQYEGQSGFVDLEGNTDKLLTISGVKMIDEGYYRVVVSNNLGTVISDEVFLNVVDEVPKVNELSCTAEFKTVHLSWDNPDLQDNNWDKVLVVRKRDDAPSSPEDGVEIYNGTGTYVIDRILEDGEYHYAVYTYIETDTDIVYSEAVTEEVVISDLSNKKLLRIDPEEEKIKIGQNTRGDLYSIWNEKDITIGRGPTGNESSLWINSNIIGNAENQIPAGSEIVSARLVFTVEGSSFDDEISEDNSENGNINPYTYNVGNPVEASYIGRSIYGSDAHSIKLYQISDIDNLGLPYYAVESGVRVGLDFNYRDHRPGMNIPWVDIDEIDEEQVNNEDNLNEDSQNEMDQYKPGSIQLLLNEIEPVDIMEFSPDVFKDKKAKTVQFDITEAVQNYSEEAAVNPDNGSASEEQGLYITIDYGWNKGEYIRLYGSTAEVEDGEAETEESEAGAKDEEDLSDIRPYLEIIYSDGTDDLTAPEPVKRLTVIPGENSVELKWTNPSDSDFTGVKIIRREGMIPYNIQDGSNGEEGVFVNFLEETGNTGSELTYTDSNLLPGHRYYYAVYTYDDSYNYSKAVWIKGVPGSPDSPENLSTSNSGAGEVTLNWDKVTGADSYRIYYEDIDGNYILIDEVVDENPENQGTELEYTDYVSSGEYIYRISAVNENGEGPLSEGLAVTVGNNTAEEPVAPTGLIAEAISSSKIRINWTDQSDNEIGFMIERKNADSDWKEVGKTRHNKVEYIDSELLPATQYNYRIKAFNSAGETYSDTISCTTEDGPVQQINWQLISASQIRVKWEDVMDGMSYRVEIYELDSNKEISEDDEALDTQLISGVDYCYFVSLEPAKEYRVKVISLKNNEEIGEIESDIIRTSMDPKGGLF